MDFEQALKALRQLQAGESDALPLKELIGFLETEMEASAALQATVSGANSERDAAIVERDAVIAERDAAREGVSAVESERDALTVRVDGFRERTIDQVVGYLELSGKEEGVVSAFRTRATGLTDAELQAELTVAKDAAKSAMEPVTNSDDDPKSESQVNWGGIDI